MLKLCISQMLLELSSSLNPLLRKPRKDTPTPIIHRACISCYREVGLHSQSILTPPTAKFDLLFHTWALKK